MEKIQKKSNHTNYPSVVDFSEKQKKGSAVIAFESFGWWV